MYYAHKITDPQAISDIHQNLVSNCEMWVIAAGYPHYRLTTTGELSDETRTFARIIASLKEERDAIGWSEQRISVEKDKDAKKIMEHAQEEEFLHFSMDLEFLLRCSPK